MVRKPVKKSRMNNENLVKARRVRTERMTVRRLATQLEREAVDLQRTAAILRRRSAS